TQREGQLQRSPDVAVGDRSTWSGCPAPTASFNGAPTSPSGIEVRRARARRRAAASTEPRRRRRGSGGRRGRCAGLVPLQRSPDVAVGDRAPAAAGALPLRGFNGAPTSPSGIAPGRLPLHHQLVGFNGAPTSPSGIELIQDGAVGPLSGFNGAPTSPSG